MPRNPRLTYRAQLLVSAFLLAALTGLFFLPLNSTHSAVTDGSAQTTSSAQVSAPALQKTAAADSAPDKAEIAEAYGKLPLSFEANAGQAHESVKFLARGPGYSLFLTGTEAVLTLKKAAAEDGQRATLRMRLVGANSAPQVSGQEELPGKSNYFVGNDPQKWRTGVSNYARVQYRNVYPGVDMVYYGNQGQLEYDFVVAPGVSPRAIALGFEGVDRLEIDGSGELVLHTAGGEVRQHKPVVYQEVDGARREIAASYVLKGKREVGFAIGNYDAASPLVIDPVLVYSTYLGGINSDSAYGIAIDASGQAFVTGTTASDNFPVSSSARQKARGPYPGRTTANYSDAFVTKLNGAGTAIVYSTYLGGGIAGEIGKGIAVDASGNAYVTGVTGGGNVVAAGTNDFPVVNAFQSKFGGTDDTFVTKLNPTGSAIIFSTFLGGNGTDSGEKIVVNATGDAYVTGSAVPANFPTTAGAFKSSGCDGCASQPAHAFVTKFDTTGTVEWSTLVGAGYAYDIAIDGTGHSYITGASSYVPNTTATGSPFPVTPGAHQTTSGGLDAFVAKLNPFGSALVYSTYLGGGPKADRGFGIAIDPDGNAYVTGQTQNAAFPVTAGAFDVTYNSTYEDAFVAKLNADGSDVLFATFLGGTLQDVGRGIAIDKARNVYITGQTKSVNFPVKNSLQPKTFGTEIFLTKLNAAGSALVYSTYLGTGEGRDLAYSEAYGAYLTGLATQIPVTNNAFQTVGNAETDAVNYDAFVMRVKSTNETTPVFSIGGRVTDTSDGGSPSPGVVTMKLTGSQNRTTNLMGSTAGTYSFGALPAGNYTVTPSKPGFRFEPESQTFNSLAMNQVADFAVVPNDAPTVTLTSPAQSASYTAPASITLTATAADTDGTVKAVQFYANTTQGTTVIIATDTTAPYSATWSNVGGGNYVLGAIAKDDLGSEGYSEGIAITVASTVPATVALTSPPDGYVYKTGDNINVNASVTGGGATAVDYVDFYAGTTLIGRDTVSPYGIVWRPTTAGDFSLTAKAVDLGKAVGTSPARTVTVNDTVSTLQGLISEGGTPLSGVTVTLSGTKTGTVTTGANGMYSFPNLPAEGGYTVTPSKAGYTFNPESFTTDFLGYYDRGEHFAAIKNSAVSVMITSPSWGASYTAPATVTINAQASSTAGPITKVEFYANTQSGNVFIGTDTTAPYSFVWRNVAAGNHDIYVVATDSTGGAKTTQSNVIFVEPAPTTVAISGQIVDGDGTGMAGLKVTLSGTKALTAITNSGGYYGFGGLPVGGNYTVTPPATYTFAPASYTYNNLTTDEIEAYFSTTSFNSAPVVTLTSPTANASYTAPATVTLSATASDKDGTVKSVQFFRRTPTASTSLGIDSVAPYTLNWGVSTAGTYEIVAVAVDNAGWRSTSATVTITVKSGTASLYGGAALGGDALTAALAGDLSSEASGSPFAELLSLSGSSLSPLVFDHASTVSNGWLMDSFRGAKASAPAPTSLIPFMDLALAGARNL